MNLQRLLHSISDCLTDSGRSEESNLLSIWRELDISDWFLKVEMVEDCRTLEVDENCSTICSFSFSQYLSREEDRREDSPSSTEIRTVESGERATLEIFLRFSNANVRDLLLEVLRMVISSMWDRLG